MKRSLAAQHFCDVELKMTLDEFRQSLTATEPPADGLPDFRQLLIWGRHDA